MTLACSVATIANPDDLAYFSNAKCQAGCCTVLSVNLLIVVGRSCHHQRVGLLENNKSQNN
ncbi:MAG: hypothetical protein ACJA2E_001922 [Arenicella sp.]|jgi:hypothetical protein